MAIDDDLDTLKLLDLMLRRQGYQLITVNSGVQAFELIEKEKPELVLLDLMMPGMDGIEVARRLRSSPETKDILIIIFSAKDTQVDKLAGFEAGADDYLVKPVQPRELLAHIKAVLQHTTVPRRLPAPVKENKGKRIGILAANGGVGVSTLAVNLGIALFQRSQKPVLVGDYRPGNSTISYDIQAPGERSLEHLLSLAPEQITAQKVENELFTHASGVRFLPASVHPADAYLSTASDQFEQITRLLPGLGDTILLDLGSSLSPAVKKVLQLCQYVIVLLEPTPHSIQGTRLLLEEVKEKVSATLPVEAILMDRSIMEAKAPGDGAGERPGDRIEDALGRKILTTLLPEPGLAVQAQLSKLPLILFCPESAAARQFVELADRLIHQLG